MLVAADARPGGVGWLTVSEAEASEAEGSAAAAAEAAGAAGAAGAEPRRCLWPQRSHQPLRGLLGWTPTLSFAFPQEVPLDKRKGGGGIYPGNSRVTRASPRAAEHLVLPCTGRRLASHAVHKGMYPQCTAVARASVAAWPPV